MSRGAAGADTSEEGILLLPPLRLGLAAPGLQGTLALGMVRLEEQLCRILETQEEGFQGRQLWVKASVGS